MRDPPKTHHANKDSFGLSNEKGGIQHERERSSAWKKT